MYNLNLKVKPTLCMQWLALGEKTQMSLSWKKFKFPIY